MDPFEREFGFRRRMNVESILAFLAGVLAAYLLQRGLGLRGGSLFTVIIVVAVGGLWYHIRRVI